jgi:purine-cytosine permease-like protein
MSKLYNWANILIFTVISAAMVTVSSTAVRFAFGIPAQLDWYPTNLWFVLIVLLVGIFVVFVALYGFKAVSDFSGICAPWLFTMFASGAIVLMPALSLDVLGFTLPGSWADFVDIGNQSIWTGVNSEDKPGIGLVEVIGFGWAANTITHFGLIDMALLRFAKKKYYGLATSTGMLFGHYIAWIAAGIMGAGTAVILGESIVQLDPGDVAYYALGWSGFVIVIVAGWTTAITNLYRAGLAAQAIYTNHSLRKTTMIVGVAMIIIACFPFVFSQILPLLTYAGLLVVPVGAIVFTEHQIFPKIGYTRYWSKFQEYKNSSSAVLSWIIGLIFGFGLNALDVMSFYYLFIPTWFFTILVYTFLASKYGANKKYPEDEKKEDAYNKAIVKYHKKLEAEEPETVQDVSIYTKALKLVSYGALGLTLFLAIKTLVASPDEAAYISNRAVFYQIGFACTLIYFIGAYWAMQRRKSLNNR